MSRRQSLIGGDGLYCLLTWPCSRGGVFTLAGFVESFWVDGDEELWDIRKLLGANWVMNLTCRLGHAIASFS